MQQAAAQVSSAHPCFLPSQLLSARGDLHARSTTKYLAPADLRCARNPPRMLTWQITVGHLFPASHAFCATLTGLFHADVKLKGRQAQKFREIKERFFSMTPAETSSRSQLAQAPPPQPSATGSASRDQPSASASPRDHMESSLAALQQGSYSAMSNDNPAEEADARNKSKRELSTSKRAAQNRAAQVRTKCRRS